MSLIGIKKDEPRNNGLGHEILTSTKYKSLIRTTEDLPSHESSGHKILAPTKYKSLIGITQSGPSKGGQGRGAPPAEENLVRIPLECDTSILVAYGTCFGYLYGVLLQMNKGTKNPHVISYV